MKNAEKPSDKPKSAGPDRRQAQRYNTTLALKIKFQADGTPVDGSAVEIGPNGMRLRTRTPLMEMQYVHITFEEASNNTFCEGRVVWTERVEGKEEQYESGIDIQQWGGGSPGADFIHTLPIQPQKDRRKKPR